MSSRGRSLVRRLAYATPLLRGELRARAEWRAEQQRLRGEIHDLRKQIDSEFCRVREILQFIYDNDPANRERLWQLRASDKYEPAFTEPEPLVSVVIPTYTNVEGLANVSVPSVLAQTYRNFELIVVGDCAPPETGEALAAFDDPRIVYYNRERNGPYPDDPRRLHLVKGSPALNEATRRAQGRWIAHQDDDDAYRPHALETLVSAAQEQRAEFCYGQALHHYRKRKSEAETRGSWPPGRRSILIQASIYHRGLARFIEHELGYALFDWGNEKTLIRRMLNIGVRFGFVEDVLADYYPSASRNLRSSS